MSLSAKTDDKLAKAEKKLEQLETDWKQKEEIFKKKRAEYLKEISELKAQAQGERSMALGEMLVKSGIDINNIATALQSGDSRLMNLLAGLGTTPKQPTVSETPAPHEAKNSDEEITEADLNQED